MLHKQFHLNRYFWATNIFFWLAVHALFALLEFGAAKSNGSELSWLRTWYLMSPWFLSWIWVTAGVFCAVNLNTRVGEFNSKYVLKHLAWMIGLLTSYWAFCSVARVLIRGEKPVQFWDFFVHVLFTSAQVDVLIYLGVLAAAMSFRFYHKSMQESSELKRLEHELTQEQLKTLRSQLNPHFLFNTLNTIASLVRLKRDTDAVTALSELSQMLRRILEEGNDTVVTIKDEIAFINSYLSIQKMRFSDKLKTYVSVQLDCLELKIPTMILHPLVENAVQHGSQLESNKNPISLVISRTETELTLLITNKVAKDDPHKGFGIGLTNTRERLAKIYTNFTLELERLENDLFETQLTLPIEKQEN